MTARRLMALVHRDLLDAWRDRRTVVMMLGLPLVLYPVLVLGAVGIGRHQTTQRPPGRVLLAGAPSALAPLHRALAADPALEADLADRLPAALDALRRGEVDVVLEVRGDVRAALDQLQPLALTLYHDGAEGASRRARRAVEKRLTALGDRAVTRVLTDRGFPPEALHPLSWRTRDVASPEKLGGYALGGAFIYLLVFVTMLGAYFPAVEMGAGERERGTLEALLISPLRRSELVVGKFIALLAMSYGTALANLLSLGLTFTYGLMWTGGKEHLGDMGLRLDPARLALMPLMILPFAALFAALMLLVSFFARSSREAQTYLSPIMLALIVPMVFVMMPGVHLDGGWAWVPFLNLCLLLKDLMVGRTTPVALVSTVAATGLYTALLLLACLRTVRDESFGQGGRPLVRSLLQRSLAALGRRSIRASSTDRNS